MRNLLIATGLMTALCASQAHATFMSIDFENDTVGSAPATGLPSNPVTIPYAIGGYDPNYASPPSPASGTITVEDVGGMSKAAQLTTVSTNGILGALWLDTAFSQASQQISVSFDVNILAAPNDATVQPKLLNGGPASAGILLGMNTFGTGTGARFAAAPTSAGGGVFAIRTPDNSSLQTFFSYVEGETYNVTLNSNYDTGTVSTYVDGDYKGSFAFANGAQAGFTTQEFFFHLNGESGYSNSVALDNITAAVPEPAAVGLLAIGGAALLLRRRRRA